MLNLVSDPTLSIPKNGGRPDVELPIFLGVVTRMIPHRSSVDFSSLTSVVDFPFFPMTLFGTQLIVGANDSVLASQLDAAGEVTYEFIFIDQRRPTISHTVKMQCKSPGERPRIQATQQYQLMSVPVPRFALLEPTVVSVFVKVEGKQSLLGNISCRVVEPPPLLSEERRALQSRPNAAGTYAVVLQCPTCKSGLRVYAMLDESSPLPADPITSGTDKYRSSDLPERWQCKCGYVALPLQSLRKGMHDLFRRVEGDSKDNGSELSFRPLYQGGELRRLFVSYQNLIHSSPREEDVQQFFESNPLLWSFLSPERIIHKPAILTHKKADFAIVTSRKILYFVEIEKPQTTVWIKSGGMSSEVQKGIDQLRDWAVVVDDHRLTLLRELGLSSLEIHDIRYLLLAGLMTDTPPDGIIRMKRNPVMANGDFLFFDELGSMLFTLENQLGGI
jgi:hypothetical protein